MAFRTRLLVLALLAATSACTAQFDGGGTNGKGGKGGSGGRDAAAADVPQSDRPAPQLDAPPSRDGYVRPTVGACTTPPTTKKAMGQACGCNAECATDFCVDGVCCSSACTGGCMACNVPGLSGTCAPVPAGVPPVVPSQCKAGPAASCGLDGTCDGNGACRSYPDGTMCSAGTCEGTQIIGAKMCRAGQCLAGGNVICAPYLCNAATGSCFDTCASNAQCDGKTCVAGSCGKKAIGALCSGASDCESGFCADGVCCNLACTGACLSCNQPDNRGKCSAVAAGTLDPHRVCKREAPESCGQSGACNGLGGCAKHGAGTTCRGAVCSGGSLVPAGSCDGAGTCIAGSPINCAPSICSTGACKIPCGSDADCAAPNKCVAGSCGLQGLGQTCTTGGQCKSGVCADGVCCDKACDGKCSFCAFPNSLGRCVAVPAGVPDQRAARGVTDPAKVCADQGAASCGTNGKCDGNGGCQAYGPGTVCKAESCDASSGRWTAEATCQSGTCVKPPARSCAPYRCNGTQCGNACTTNAQCSSPNVCRMDSCGKKAVGTVCARSSECASGSCAQGVCCATSCGGSCFACNLPGSTGTCKPVRSGGGDPTGQCKDEGPSSCGNDGTCNGSGGCRKYGSTTICAAQKCTDGTKTTPSTCSGTGTCVAGTPIQCAPYVCNTEGTDCFNSCSGPGVSPQCLPPNRCADQKCGPAGKGQDCTVTTDCARGLFCVGGVCCDGECTGGCKTCTLAGSVGTCKNLQAGTTDGSCAIDATKPCGNTGLCDGAGDCAKAPSTTVCAAPVCTSESAGTQAATCDGSGKCNPPEPLICGNNKCDVNGCKACATDADCVGGKACDAATGLCGGKLANGVACTMSTECASDACVDGLCCEKVCGECQVCKNTTTERGKCVNRAVDETDPDTCTDVTTTNPCGTIGKCDGAGQCKTVANGNACGTTCNAAGDSTVVQTCQSGGCTGTGASVSCNGLACLAGAGNTPATCATMCTVATGAGCPSGKVCVGGTQCRLCDPNDNRGCTGGQVCENDVCVNKTAKGGACTATDQCVSGNFCVDGRCCESSSCGTCQACGSDGKCAAVTNAPDADTCQNETNGTVPNPCGKLGCDATGTCRYRDTTYVCDGPSCDTSSSVAATTCNGMGQCNQQSTTACMPGYRCSNGVCPTSCTTDSQCLAPKVCNIAMGMTTGTCGDVAKKPLGGSCTVAGDCFSGFCADGVCCNAGCGNACESCSAMGMCAPVVNGTDAQCPDETGTNICGRAGMCDATGTCAYRASGVVCGAPACDGETGTTTPTCNGAGACSGAATAACGSGYKCANGVCPTSCTSSAQCVSPKVCNIPMGMTTGTCGDVVKKALGDACGAASECDSDKCVDGRCCGVASCGTCQACGTSGTCEAVVSAPDPDTCPNEAGVECGKRGCDGAGACTFADTNTTCGATCTSATELTSYKCTGAGACGTMGTVTPCASGQICSGNACQPDPGPGG